MSPLDAVNLNAVRLKQTMYQNHQEIDHIAAWLHATGCMHGHGPVWAVLHARVTLATLACWTRVVHGGAWWLTLPPGGAAG